MEANHDKKHKCTYPGCPAVFNRPYKLGQHLLLHLNIKVFACVAENCSKSYTSKSHLDRHVNTVHLKKDDSIYSCPQCLQAYANRQNLKRHMKEKHRLNIPFCCDICKKDFRKKHLLSAHMFQHTGIKSFNCDMCDKEFESLLEKKKHMKLHKVYKCDECPLSFNRWSLYQKHKKLKHAEFICNDCNRKFKTRCHIVRHVKLHNRDKMTVFQCPYENCAREYSRNSNLKQHILIKHVKLTYECHICNAKLCTKFVLERHIRSHSNPKVNIVKTLATGRKPRKDKGTFKKSTAMKLAGLGLSAIEIQECSSFIPKLEDSVAIVDSSTDTQV